MLAVSLMGVNFGFWSHLGCSGQNAMKSVSHLGLLHAKKYKKVYTFNIPYCYLFSQELNFYENGAGIFHGT